MSIYPVPLAKWFPIGDQYYFGDSVEYYRCLACGRKPRYSKAWGHHSLPWGYGDVWCSEKCLYSGKTARPDKRRERSIKRRWGRSDKKDYFIIDNPIKLDQTDTQEKL